MGTRSLTYVYSEHDDKPLVCMYRQFDGYPEGHGKELAEFLVPFALIDGIPVGQENPANLANGMSCLAAQMIAHFKTGVGGFYLHQVDVVANADGWQEYEYHVYHDRVVVTTGGAKPAIFFEGTWQNFLKWCNKQSQEKEEVEPTKQLALPDALKAGIVEVSFTKVDGSLRVMRCTTNVDYLPGSPSDSAITGYNPNIFKVWDVEVKGWRSFRKDSIIGYKAE